MNTGVRRSVNRSRGLSSSVIDNRLMSSILTSRNEIWAAELKFQSDPLHSLRPKSLAKE